MKVRLPVHDGAVVVTGAAVVIGAVGASVEPGATVVAGAAVGAEVETGAVVTLLEPSSSPSSRRNSLGALVGLAEGGAVVAGGGSGASVVAGAALVSAGGGGEPHTRGLPWQHAAATRSTVVRAAARSVLPKK